MIRCPGSVCGLLAGLFFAVGALAGSAPRVPVRVDHHVHLHSPAIQAFLPAFCESVKRYGKCDPAFVAPLKPADLLAQMDQAGIRRALVMSTGYLAESPMMVPRRSDADSLLRAANDWMVALARRYPERFGAFIAVDPLRPTALAEIARWRGEPAVTGIKLHLTSSAVDLRRDSDVAALAAVFRAAARARLAVMIHLRTQRMDYGAPNVQRFLDKVLPAAGDTPVQIAHAGGWGGVDQGTLSALGAFADAIEAHPDRFEHVWFDLAGVGRDDTPPAERQALVGLIRRIGLKHFVSGSDWPFGGELATYYDKAQAQIPLTAAEWATVRSNAPPYAGGK